MNSKVPNSKIEKLTPLHRHSKSNLVEEEPQYLDDNYKEIKFNEQLIILNYSPETKVTYVRE